MRSGISASLKPFKATVLIFTLSPAVRGSVDALQNAIQVAPSGYLAKLVRIQSVKRDVDAADTVGGQIRCHAGKLRPVGRQRQLVEPVADVPRNA